MQWASFAPYPSLPLPFVEAVILARFCRSQSPGSRLERAAALMSSPPPPPLKPQVAVFRLEVGIQSVSEAAVSRPDDARREGRQPLFHDICIFLLVIYYEVKGGSNDLPISNRTV